MVTRGEKDKNQVVMLILRPRAAVATAIKFSIFEEAGSKIKV